MPRAPRIIAHLLAAVAVVAAATFVPAAAREVDALGCLNNCTTLTFDVGGTGAGEIQLTTSSYVPNGQMTCVYTNGVVTGSCSHKFQNTLPPQKLTAYYLVTPAVDSEGCQGSDCSVAPSRGSVLFTYDTTLGVGFDPDAADWAHLDVTVTGTGSGHVTSSPAGLACPSTCHGGWLPGTSVTLTPTPAAGSTFTGWSGVCAAFSTQCSLNLVQAGTTGLTATFAAIVTPPPTAPPTPRPTPVPTPTFGTPAPSHAAAPTPTTATTATPAPGPTTRPGSTPSAPTAEPGATGGAASPASSGETPSGDVAAAGGTGAGPTAGPGAPAAAGDLGSAGQAAGTQGDGLVIAIVLAIGIAVAGIAIAIGLAMRGRGRPA